jgi:membrane protease YdiL (CAAX protease family)
VTIDSATRRRDRWTVVLLSVALLGYNSLVSLSRIPELWAFFANLGLGGALLLLTRRIALSSEEAGLRAQSFLKKLGLGIGIGIVVFAGVVLAISAADANKFGAVEASKYEGWGLLLKLAIYIPIGTALVEEFAFRGVLLGVWQRVTARWKAVVGSSIIFSVWHIPSTLGTIPTESWSAGSTLKDVVIAMVGTLLLGLFLGFLRLRTGAIWAGVPLHAAFNAGGVVGVLRRSP